MKSHAFIVSSVIALWILHWTSDIFPGGVIPLAFTASFFILDIFGAFKKDKEAMRQELADRNNDDGVSDRTKEFRRKLEEGKRAEGKTDAVLRLVNHQGEESAVLIYQNGVIEYEGNVDPKIKAAAEGLRNSIKSFGVESVAQELLRQIEEGQKND